MWGGLEKGGGVVEEEGGGADDGKGQVLQGAGKLGHGGTDSGQKAAGCLSSAGHGQNGQPRLAKRSKERGFRSQIIFIQDYDIDLARYLVAGVDIWLNNPLRPHEASGTSGMKAGMNGVLNVSISDGWVPEGIQHGKNGWIFGKGDADSAVKDREELFKLLENTILPLYFEKPVSRKKTSKAAKITGMGPEYSQRWIAMMKEAIRSITSQFNTDRMLTEYIEKMYLPAVRNAAASGIFDKSAAAR